MGAVYVGVCIWVGACVVEGAGVGVGDGVADAEDVGSTVAVVVREMDDGDEKGDVFGATSVPQLATSITRVRSETTKHIGPKYPRFMPLAPIAAAHRLQS